MKKILALLLAGCMALALCACGTPAEPADETGSGGDANASANGDTVVIGVFEPLSGDNGAGGKQEVLGMQYANAETPTVDIGGKTYNVKLEVVDNESSNDKAVSAASNLISKNVSIILGSYGSGVSIAASDTFAAEKLGMECVVESFPKNNSDFTSYLTTAKNEGADVIFAPTSISYAQLIVEQAAAQGIDMPLLASDTWDSNVILGAAKGKDVKVYVTTFYAEGGNAEFEKGFKEWIKSDSTNLSNNGGNDIISAVSVMGYDAYYTALEALKAAGTTNPQDVMAALPGVKYTGITGEISFNEEGDANRDSAFVKTANTESGLWDFVTVQGIDGAQ